MRAKTVADEVRRRMTAAGLNPKSLSRAAGLNETYVRDILSGKSKNPRTAQLKKLAEALECTVNDLDPPRLKMGPVKAEEVKIDPNEPTFYTTRIGEIGVYTGMGGGGTPDRQNIIGEWRMPTEWLRSEVRGDLNSIAILTLEGDSMAGTLEPGDKVVVDLNRRIPSPPGLFVLWDGLAQVAKRLEYIEGSDPPTVRIISDNGSYKTYDRTTGEVQIIGRIMGRWQRLS